MFVRLRWFIYGIGATVLALAFVIRRARSLKVRLDAEGAGRIAASYTADIIEATGTALKSSAQSADDDPRSGI